MSEQQHTAENDAPLCGATHQSIDNGAPCKYLAGHLDVGIPHTTASGFWWSDDTRDLSPAWCLCGFVDDRGDGTCGNCGLRIMTDDDETGTSPIPSADGGTDE